MTRTEQGRTFEIQKFSVALQELVVAEPKQVINFNPWIYATHADRLSILDDDLGSYLAECLMLTTEGIVTLDKEKGFIHKSGVAYRELTQRAIKHYVSNPEVVERFTAEGTGFDRGQALVEYFVAIGSPLPPFIIASAPGNVYDVGEDEKHSKSLTYVAIPLGYDNFGKPRFRLISIPTKEISVEDHWAIETEVANIQCSLEILSLNKVELSPNGLVQLPLWLLPDSLDKLAKLLHFDSWDAIEKDIQISSLLENDNDRTTLRRKSMLHWSGDIIRALIRDGQPESEFDALQETLRQVFAAERGGKYATEKYLDLHQVTLEMEQLFVGNGGSSEYAPLFVEQARMIERLNSGEATPSGSRYNRILSLLAQGGRNKMMDWINGNPDALDSYVGTGCGKGGSDKKYRGQDILSARHQFEIPSKYDLISSETDLDSEESSSSPDDIVVTLDSGETYVLKIRDGWKCNFDGCDRVSNFDTKVRIGLCHICEYCDPNVHKAE